MIRVVDKLEEGAVRRVLMYDSSVEVTLESGKVCNYERVEVSGDELSEFSSLCRSKWMEGRKKYEAQGLPFYKADTVGEIQDELLDLANYCAVLYWEFERLKGMKLAKLKLP